MDGAMDNRRIPADSLMARAAGGDRDAFGQLAELVGPVVYRFCLAHLPPQMRDAADDARQECFLEKKRGQEPF